MNNKICKIRYINAKSSFCYLSEHSSNFINGATIKLMYDNDHTWYFTTQSLSTLAENEIGISPIYSQLLGLNENDCVMISTSQSIPGIQSLVISPESEADYQILELLAENIQSTLLDQIRVVNLNQKFVIWVSNSLHVVVNVDSIKPVHPGRLDNLTEVEVAKPKTKSVTNMSKHNTTSWSLNRYFNFNYKSPDVVSTKILGKYCNIASDICFTLQPVCALNNNHNVNLPFEGYTYKKFLPPNFDSNLYTLKIINPPLNVGENISAINKYSLVIRIVVLDDTNEKYDNPLLYVHSCILTHFNIKSGAKALLNNTIELKPVINKIELTLQNEPKKNVTDAINNFKSFLRDNCQSKQLLLNSNIVFNTNNQLVRLKFFPSADYCLVDADVIRNCSITVSDLEIAQIEPVVEQPITFCESFSTVTEILEDLCNQFKMNLMDIGALYENSLIVGKTGTGKTTLTKIISNTLKSRPFHMHTEIISCKTLKGKTLESLHKLFCNAILNLLYYQPSVLILDDLQMICGKVIEEEALTPEALHFNRVSEMLANLLDTFLKNNKVAVLATSDTTNNLNQCIFSTRGLHLFKNVLAIGNLTKEDRFQLIKFLLEQKCDLDIIDLDELAMKTDGFVVQDIVDFVDKAAFECFKELPTIPKITMAQCNMALKNIVAISLQDVKLHSPGDRDFSDIGGLDIAKDILIESMMWPVQFPEIFGNAPLRLQSGLLLYGPPGTGKTIIAGAAAKQFGLRLISIKGPELLSKYIGSSEQSIRNVFEKAQNAKPCILFFDEFDSLAPRRGHDSTGVTDRVVNQLLTQLDGIESLNGICVLAATSRPDLLDPALLRPGRFDKQILCPLPDTASRVQILKALSKKLTFACDIDLLKVAEKCGGYSGADLQAVLYTAQLSHIQEMTDSTEGEMPDVIEINQKHLESALRATRPSLTKQELLKYEKIYSRFEQGNFIPDRAAEIQKATLA